MDSFYPQCKAMRWVRFKMLKHLVGRWEPARGAARTKVAVLRFSCCLRGCHSDAPVRFISWPLVHRLVLWAAAAAGMVCGGMFHSYPLHHVLPRDLLIKTPSGTSLAHIIFLWLSTFHRPLLVCHDFVSLSDFCIKHQQHASHFAPVAYFWK